MLIEALKPLRVKFPEQEIHLKPGQPVELPEEHARKLLAKAGDRVRVAASPCVSEGSWPSECLASELKFGTYEARLYPLLQRMVRTPQGPGKLVQVFAGRAAVILTSQPEAVCFLDPCSVRPAPELGGL